MKKEIGLWIDHQQAVIVTIQNQAEAIKHIESNVDKRVHHESFTESKSDRRFIDQLTHYYDEILTHLHDATDVYIMGPGEAKVEFLKHLESQKLTANILPVETADKMTDPQIAAQVRSSFEKQIN